MVTPRLRALERTAMATAQLGNARSGMIGRGRVQSVDLLTATATVQRYGRAGQLAKLNNVGIIGFPDAAQIAGLRGEEVITLFPSGKAGAGEAWILGAVTRPASLYDSLVSRIDNAVSIVDHTLSSGDRRDTLQVVSSVNATDNRQVTIAAFEIAADSATNISAMQIVTSPGGVEYQSVTIEEIARVSSSYSISSEAPIIVLVPTGSPWRETIPANTSLELTLSFRAVKSTGVSFGTYRVFTGVGAASRMLFSPKDSTKDNPLIRIRGQVVTL